MAALGNREYWKQFIDIYKSLPAVWKVRSEEYKSRTEKNRAYMKLMMKLKELDKNADRASVLKKINTIRGNYRREIKKIKQCKKDGIEYVPTLWYFKNLSFLNDNWKFENNAEDVLIKNNDSYESDNATGGDDNEQTVDYFEEFVDVKPINAQDNFECIDFDVNECSKNVIHDEAHSTHNTKKRNFIEMECTQINERQTDEADIYSQCWALQYRELSREQRLFAKKAIDDVLFEARLGMLHRNSVKINQENNVDY